MVDTRAVMRSLPLVASILGRRYGVKVEIGGPDAYTDGNTIHLPSLPANDDTLLPLVRGYLDHESGHVRETDFEALRKAKLSPFEKYVWNTIEDWRVENKLAALFPGCRQNLNWLIEHFFGTDNISLAKGDPANILNWIILTVRSWDVSSLEGRRDKVGQTLDTDFPGVRASIAPVLSQVRLTCTSTQDAVEHAREITMALRKYARKSQRSYTPSEKAPNDQRPNSKDLAGLLQTSLEDLKGDCPLKASQALVGLLDAGAQALPKEMGSAVAEAIQQASAHPNHCAVATEHPREATLLPDHALAKARTASTALKTRLQGLLQTKVLTRSAIGRRGRLSSTLLHRLAISDGRVFRQKSERQGLSTAVHILLDSSGSMSGNMQLACAACHAVAVALETTGVNVGLTAFPGQYQTNLNSWATVTRLIRHGQRTHACIDTPSAGDTPLAETLWWAMQTMLPLKERRKLILVITDGDPDSRANTLDALRAAERAGFEVYGLGIKRTSIQALLPTRSLVITQLSELAPAMFTLLQRAMLGTA